MGKRRFRRAGLALAICAILSGVTPAAGAAELLAPSREVRDTPPIFENTLRTMKELGVPDRILEQIRSGTDIDSTTDVYAFGASDLNGDGIREVIEWKVTYAFSVDTGGQNETTGVEERFATILTIRSGDNGKKLWRKSYDDFVIPVDTIVADGRRGIVTIGGLLSMLGTSGERNVDFQSLKGTNGKRFWSRRFTSLESEDALTHISEDAPISIGFARALPGKPMDVVISLATQVSTLFTTTVAARVVVVDGKDGEAIPHPRVDVSLGWLPFSNPVGDLDGDGLDDYVVTNDPGVDLGGPQEPPSVGGTIYARKGTDGSEIWTTSGLELNDFGWAGELPNVVGGATREVALLTPNDPEWRDFAVYLFDGATGFLRWKKLGLGVMAPGDVDRDGKIDLAMGDASISFKRHEAAFTTSVFAGSGRKIYKKKHRWSFEGLPCPEGLCSRGAGYGWGSGGDVHPDGVKETYIFLQVQQDPDEAQTHTILADGRYGKELSRGDGTPYPAYAEIDGQGDDLFRSETRGGISVITVLDGLSSRQLLRTVIQRSRGLLPASAWAGASGFKLPGDRCDELIVNMLSKEGSFYAILDGGSGRPLWSRWHGDGKARPRFTTRTDTNRAC